MAKPPTQTAGVVGIEPKPIELTPAPERRIDWRAITALPPFQMFAAERMRNTSGNDSQEHAMAYVRAQGGGNDLLDGYVQWHAAKGYWTNETPTGAHKE